jgi:hypothetical protein
MAPHPFPPPERSVTLHGSVGMMPDKRTMRARRRPDKNVRVQHDVLTDGWTSNAGH